MKLASRPWADSHFMNLTTRRSVDSFWATRSWFLVRDIVFLLPFYSTEGRHQHSYIPSFKPKTVKIKSAFDFGGGTEPNLARFNVWDGAKTSRLHPLCIIPNQKAPLYVSSDGHWKHNSPALERLFVFIWEDWASKAAAACDPTAPASSEVRRGQRWGGQTIGNLLLPNPITMPHALSAAAFPAYVSVMCVCVCVCVCVCAYACGDPQACVISSAGETSEDCFSHTHTHCSALCVSSEGLRVKLTDTWFHSSSNAASEFVNKRSCWRSETRERKIRK